MNTSTMPLREIEPFNRERDQCRRAAARRGFELLTENLLKPTRCRSTSSLTISA
jgi:hypothetical protein